MGVQEMTPLASVRPIGNAPDVTDHVAERAAGVEPDGGLRVVTSCASSVAEYGVPNSRTRRDGVRHDAQARIDGYPEVALGVLIVCAPSETPA